MGEQGRVPPVPQLAASLILVRDNPFEVLLVRRPPTGTFPSALVFPGGVVEPDDEDDHWLTLAPSQLARTERALRIAAVRETWEESGLVVATSGAVSLDGASGLRAIVAAGGGLDLTAIHDFAHWITPEISRRRFDTRFFLARAPEGQPVRLNTGEIVDFEWVSPRTAITRSHDGIAPLLPPTRLNIQRLAASESVDDAIAAAQRIPLVPVRPALVRAPGGHFVTIPQNAGYAEYEYFIPDGPVVPRGRES